MSVNIIVAAFAKRSKWPVYGAKNRHLYGSVNVQDAFVRGIVSDVGVSNMTETLILRDCNDCFLYDDETDMCKCPSNPDNCKGCTFRIVGVIDVPDQ